MDHANARGVAIVHVKVANPVGGYRYLMVRFMNEFSILDTNMPMLRWLRSLSDVDLRGDTYHLLVPPVDFECNAYDPDEPNPNHPSPPPPW